ncbi:hypothetical protein GCM10027048_05480 [Hymenobacter coalescens]
MAPERLIPLYNALDLHADRAQHAWRRLYICSLVGLGLIGLAHEVWAITETLWIRIFVCALTVGGAIYEVYYQFGHRGSFARWTTLRAKAEKLKSEVWCYLFDLGPHGGAYSPAEWRRFQQQLAGEEFGKYVAADELAQQKSEYASLSEPQKRRQYQQYRVQEQQQYFARRAQQLKRRVAEHRELVLIVLLIGVAWAILRVATLLNSTLVEPDAAKSIEHFNLLLICVLAIGLLKVYIETENVDLLLSRYKTLAHNLQQLAELPPSSSLPLAGYVQQVESTLLSQNHEWLIQRQVHFDHEPSLAETETAAPVRSYSAGPS